MRPVSAHVQKDIGSSSAEWIMCTLIDHMMMDQYCTNWSDESFPSSNRERVMQELVHGHQLANQLRMFPLDVGDGGWAQDLATKILCSFTNSLCILDEEHESKEELISLIQFQSNTGTIAAAPMPPYEDLKRRERFVDRRGSYKRRKTSQTWTTDAHDCFDDGYAWRKYGQKQILNASHPRSYFRCSHMKDQGCKATKQVQKVENDPKLFRTTYFGNHTCRHRILKGPELILDNICDGVLREEPNSMFTITFS